MAARAARLVMEELAAARVEVKAVEDDAVQR
jgi:hypothetical protein